MTVPQRKRTIRTLLGEFVPRFPSYVIPRGGMWYNVFGRYEFAEGCLKSERHTAERP